MSRADSTAWTSTVEQVHTTGFRWSWSSSATYWGAGRERAGTQVSHKAGMQLPHRHQESKAQLELQGPVLCPLDQS